MLEPGLKAGGDSMEGGTEKVVVVGLAPGVAGDVAVAGRSFRVPGGAGGFVELADAKEGLGFGEDEARVGADLSAVVSEVGHAGSKTTGHPGEVAVVIGVRQGGGEAGEFEAFGEGGIEHQLRIDEHSAIIDP